jgi:hypothetical protein
MTALLRWRAPVLSRVHNQEMILKMMTTAVAVAALAAVAVQAQAAEGSRWSEGIGFYIGVDSLANATGTFAGLANPNANRLTMLFDHGNHFHGIGAYSYSGTAAAPVTLPTNSNNRIPETYARTNPDNQALALTAGTGAFAGKLVSTVQSSGVNHEYGHLGAASIQSLVGLSPEADVLYGSSSGRYSQVYDGVLVGLKLESATAGLKVAANGDLDLFDTSNVAVLGDGNSFSFLPTFYVDAGAAAGTYTAQFSLVNLGTNQSVLNSGTFYIDFAVAPAVPEPGTWALMVAGLATLGAVARRRKNAA